MGMQVGPDGSLRPKVGFLTKKIPQCEELDRPGMPTCVVEEYDPLLDSSDMGPADWIKIAKTVETNYALYSGFVVIHGTDTMAYTASALSFMFTNLCKPVVLVGSMLPFGDVHSDARRNLACAILIAGGIHTKCASPNGCFLIPEVSIFFNDRLLRGNRATKIDSASFAAFDSPNCAPLAIMGTSLVVREHGHTSFINNEVEKKFAVNTDLETKIVVIRLVPGFTDLDSLVSSDVAGIVLQLYGTGNAPIRKTGFINWVKKLVDRNVLVVACSQCLRGRVSLEDYAVGKQLHDIGVVSAMDMTTEATVTKMAHLLGTKAPIEKIRNDMQTSIRGELTPHT